MPLQNEDGFFHRNLTVCRRSVALSVEFRVVRLVLLEHIVDSRKEHSGNGNNGFLVPTALFESQVAITDFRELLGTNGTERTLNKQWLDVSTGSTDSGGFLLPGAFVVLRRKPGPGAKMLRGGEHGHIHSDFRDNADSGKGLDTRSRHNKAQLRKIFSAVDRIRESRLILHSSRLSMWERMMRSFSACSAHISPSTAARISSSVTFIRFVRNPETSVIFTVGFSRIRAVIAEAALPDTSENTSSSLKLETVRQFCARFFSPVVKLVSFQR